jgi:CubicO group peptidase (beta-lactamase class C family)
MKNAVKAALTVSIYFFSAAAAQGLDPAHLSLVAGYKAAFTCSAHFNAGRSVEQIAGDELHRILPAFSSDMPSLPDAVIYEKNKRVSVAYAEGFPPRIAQWRPFLGCVQLPTGADESIEKYLPLVDLSRKRVAIDSVEPVYSLANRLNWPIRSLLDSPVASVKSDNEKLNKIITASFDKRTYGVGTETTAVLVAKNGVVIAEQYREGFDAITPQRTWSVAKSIAVTIIGAAVQEGLIGVDEQTGLEAWSMPGDPRAKIKVADLMHMSSGLDNGPAGNRTDDIYFGGGRVIDHAVTRRQIAEPGTRWYYANNDTMIMMRALRERMGDVHAFLEFPFKEVLYPLGMDHTFLETDWNGDFIMSSQVWTTARDLARIGQLYLNDGMWGDERILPEGWAKFVATPAADQPGLRANGDPSPGYGAQFWLYDESFGLPAGSYAARGNRGQYLMIIPERNVLIVRRGFDSNQPGGARFDLAKFSRDILAVLEE